jgi:hypothetical protein
MLRPYFVDIVGKLAFEITALAPIEIIWCDSGHHLFIHDAATVHLKFKTRDRRAIEMPGQPRYLAKNGYSPEQISRAIYLLKTEANNPNRSLYDNNKDRSLGFKIVSPESFHLAARDLLQRLGHILTDLRQPRSAAACAAPGGQSTPSNPFVVTEYSPFFIATPNSRTINRICSQRASSPLTRRALAGKQFVKV